MNNKTLALLGVLAALAVFAFFTIGKRDITRTTSAEESNFALTDTANISKVTLTKMQQGKKVSAVVMTKDGKNWRLNGEANVSEPQLKLFFKTISAIRVREKVNEKGQATIEERMKESHVLVEFFQGNEKLKAYQVGMEGLNHIGSYLKIEGAENGYLVELPGLQGSLNGFFPTEANIWRENLLFNANLSNIQQVEAKFTKKTQLSLLLSREKTTSPWLLNGKSTDSTKLKPFLANFKGKIYFETIAHAQYPGKLQQLQTQLPDIIYTVTYFDGKKRAINLYMREDTDESFFAFIEGENLLLTVQHFVMDKFLTLGNPYLLWREK
ncbi:MAG: hypothetical protein ACKVTZ_03595 [Bacteroidia bacterium]